MKVQEILNLYGILDNMPSNTPLKLTVARNLKEVSVVYEDFISGRDSKFKDEVILDEEGNPSFKEEIKNLAKEKKIDISKNAQLNFYEYSEGGLERLLDYISEKEKEEVEIKLIPVKLSKLIRVNNGDTTELVSLESLLETSESPVTAHQLENLLSVGILTD